MLPERDWLDKAKRLAVGMRVRTYHLGERRPNMTIANEPDRWWCWCQRCKDGAVVLKSHVLLTQAAPAVTDTLTPPPSESISGIDAGTRWALAHFLARKGMDFTYLPIGTRYSEKARRLLVQDATGHWHGRDTTERSSAKWLHYGNPAIAGCTGFCTVLTEDVFSMFKVRHALLDLPYSVACTMGTSVSDRAALALKNCSAIVWAYDGDDAGDSGYERGARRMRAFGSTQYRARPPQGLDPKDMQCREIRSLITGVYNARS